MSSVEGAMHVGKHGDVKTFDICRMLLYWQGFWPDEAEPDLEFYLKYFSPWLAHLLVKHRFLRQALRLFRRFNPWFIILTITVQVFYLFPNAIYLYKQEPLVVVANFFAMIFLGLQHVGACSIFFQPRTMQDIFAEMDDMLTPEQLDNQEQKKIYEGTRSICYKIITHIQLPYVTLMCTSITLRQIFQVLPDRRLAFKQYLPWDITTSPAFEITAILLWIESISVTIFGTTMVSILAMCGILARSNFAILNNKLENIQVISIDRIKATRPQEVDRLEEETIVNIENEVCQQVYTPAPVLQAGTIRAAASTLDARRVSHLALVSQLYGGARSAREEMQLQDVLQGHNVNARDDDEFNNCTTSAEFHKKVRDVMTQNIQLHLKLIRYIGLCGNIGNVPLIALLVANTFVLGLSALTLTRSDETSRFVVGAVGVLSVVLTAIYLTANNMMQLISDQHEAICVSMYNSDWTGASLSFKKSMLVIMSRANVPLEMKPTGLHPLSRNNFAQVMNIAYKMSSTLSDIAQ